MAIVGKNLRTVCFSIKFSQEKFELVTIIANKMLMVLTDAMIGLHLYILQCNTSYDTDILFQQYIHIDDCKEEEPF